MLFATKLAGALLAIAASAVSVRPAVVGRHALAEISVVFYDDGFLNGASYSPDGLVQGVCTTLPGLWLDRPESVQISPGFSCTFYIFQGCEGSGIALSGIAAPLPIPSLYNNVESFVCTKAI